MSARIRLDLSATRASALGMVGAVWIDPEAARQVIEAAVASLSMLGGAMAIYSGSRATIAIGNGAPPDVVAAEVNAGISQGFVVGNPLALLALIILLS